MNNKKYLRKLPPAAELARLRRQMSYREIGRRFGVCGQTIWNRLDGAGLLARQREYCPRPESVDDFYKFWSRASTALALIREGHCRFSELTVAMGFKSKATLWKLLNRMTAEGLVMREAGKAGTLRLTEKGQQFVANIQLVSRRPDGGLGKYCPNGKAQ